MTIEFYDAVNGDGLFNILGRVFAAQGAINTARGTTVPAKIDNVLTQFQNVNPDAARNALVSSIPSALSGYQGGAGGLISTLQSFSSAFLIDFVNRDVTLPNATLSAALTELIAQMKAEAESVDRTVVAVTSTAGGSNVGTGIIVCGTVRSDGEVIQTIIAESIAVAMVSSGANAVAEFKGTPPTTALSQDWPDGSGCFVGIISIDSTTGMLINGGFDTFTDDVPDGWIAHIATPGTTIYSTIVEVQTVAITGTPAGGYYILHWIAPDSIAHSTVPLAFDASAATVQIALRTIPGLEAVEVTATGTSPNLTHSITFTGAGGNQNQFTSTNALTGGSTPTVTHGTTTAGTALVLRGSRALVIDSDGSEATAIYQKLSGLTPGTVYCCSLWAAVDVVPAAGIVKIELVDDIDGTAFSSCQFAAADLTTAFQHVSELTTAADDCMLRTPAVLPAAVYLRIRTSTAISSGTSLFLDEAVVTPASQLYIGGPLVAVITGGTNWQVGDTFTVTATNDRNGVVQEWFERNFNMSALGLLLPSNGAGSETIPDSVVA